MKLHNLKVNKLSFLHKHNTKMVHSLVGGECGGGGGGGGGGVFYRRCRRSTMLWENSRVLPGIKIKKTAWLRNELRHFLARKLGLL